VWHNLGQQDFNYFHSIFSLYKLWWHVLHLSVDLRENKFISFQKEVFLFLSLYFILGGQPGVAWDFCCMLSLSLSLCLFLLTMNPDKNKLMKLSICTSCVARCTPSCNLCAYFRNLLGQIISSWILSYLFVCPNNFNSFKSVWHK
jgi:hypothetical protein